MSRAQVRPCFVPYRKVLGGLGGGGWEQPVTHTKRRMPHPTRHAAPVEDNGLFGFSDEESGGPTVYTPVSPAYSPPPGKASETARETARYICIEIVWSGGFYAPAIERVCAVVPGQIHRTDADWKAAAAGVVDTIWAESPYRSSESGQVNAFCAVINSAWKLATSRRGLHPAAVNGTDKADTLKFVAFVRDAGRAHLDSMGRAARKEAAERARFADWVEKKDC